MINKKTDSQEDFAGAIDALRENLQATPTRESWGQQIAWAGLIAAAMGLLAWFTLVTDTTEQIQIHHMGVSYEAKSVSDKWLGHAVEQGVNAYLQASGRIHLVADPFKTAGFSLPAILHPRNRNGADWILRGEMKEVAQVLELSLNLESVINQEVRYTKILYGSVENLADLATRAANEVHVWFRLPPLTAREAQYAQAEIPGSLQAKNYMAEGLDALSRGNSRLAIKHFEAALESSPNHPIILSNLASAWSHLGYAVKARKIAQRGFEQIGNLSRAKQLSVEAGYRILNNEWERAEELYRALKEFYQQDIEYGLALANAQMKGARYNSAFATLTNLRELPSTKQSDPRIDLLESEVWYYAGDYGKGFDAASRAAVTSRSLNEPAIMADALAMQVLLAPQVNTKDVPIWKDEAQAIYEKMGDPVGLAHLLLRNGDRAFARGRYLESETIYHEALVVAARVGNERLQANTLSSLARTYDLQGDLSKGLHIKEEVLESYRRRDMKRGIGVMLENLAISHYKLGNPTESLQLVNEAEKHFEKFGDFIGTAWIPYHRARSQLLMGNVTDAETNMRRAKANATAHPEGALALHSQYELCLILLATGHFDEALNQAEKLLQDYLAVELFPDAAETRLLISRILQRLDSWPDAHKQAQKAKEFFVSSDASYYVASANTELLVCQLQARNQQQIDEACDQLESSLEHIQHGLVLLRGRTMLAQCENNAIDAQTALEKIVHAADEKQLFVPLIEANFTRVKMMKGLDNAPQELFLATKKLAEESGWWAPDEISKL